MTRPGLTLKFDSSHPEFRRGFEAGMIWSYAFNAGGIDCVVRADNTEMVMRICEALDLPWAAEEMSDDLMHITLGRALRED